MTQPKMDLAEQLKKAQEAADTFAKRLREMTAALEESQELIAGLRNALVQHKVVIVQQREAFEELAGLQSSSESQQS